MKSGWVDIHMVVGTERKVDMVEGMETMVGMEAEMIRLATVVDTGLDMAEDTGQDLVEDTSTMSMVVAAMDLDMVEATDPVMEVGTVALHVEVVAMEVLAMAGAMVEDMVVAVGMEELGAMEVDMVVALLHEADN
jgi:hypothetical protein